MPNKESANELFHFTKKYDNIKSILNDKFKPFFCVEDISYMQKEGGNMTLAYPMVCFCDIPLERIAVHRKNYGHYGIGLRKEWGKNNGFSIVSYSFPESDKSSAYRVLVDYYIERCTDFNDDSNKHFRNAFSIILMTTKPYEGKTFNKVDKRWSDKNVRLYNEREWRYIPLVDKLSWSFSLEECSDNYDSFFESIKDEQSRIQDQHKLDFTVDDITHIFLKSENQKRKLLKDISSNYSVKELRKIEKLICVNKVTKSNNGCK